MSFITFVLFLLAASGIHAKKTGTATFYGGNVEGGMCSFSSLTLPQGVYGTAMTSSNWGNSRVCGACLEVMGPTGDSIKTMVVDQCPDCGENHLDLFEDGFAQLSAQSAGVIDVTYHIVPCGLSSALSLKNKEGVSPYWFSMQVVNSNRRIKSLEVSPDGGKTWMGTSRQDYNFFEITSGTGSDSVDVRIKAINGDVVTMSNVPIQSGKEVKGKKNF